MGRDHEEAISNAREYGDTLSKAGRIRRGSISTHASQGVRLKVEGKGDAIETTWSWDEFDSAPADILIQKINEAGDIMP